MIRFRGPGQREAIADHTIFCKILVTLTRMLSYTPSEMTIKPGSRGGGVIPCREVKAYRFGVCRKERRLNPPWIGSSALLKAGPQIFTTPSRET